MKEVFTYSGTIALGAKFPVFTAVPSNWLSLSYEVFAEHLPT